MTFRHRTILCAAALVASQAAMAQGYFDFGSIPGISREPSVQVDLNPAMIGFVRESLRAADPEAAEIVSNIENVRVRVYNIVDDADVLLEFIDDTSGSLERDGWQRVVFVDDDEAKVRVYLKFEDVNATGITVMVAGQDDEAVFINVAGMINPTQLGQLAQKYGARAGLSGVDLDAAIDQTPAGRNDADED